MRISNWSADVCSPVLRQIPIGQDEDLARNLQIGCNGSDCIALRHNRALVSPWRRVGDAHGRKQTPLTLGQLRIAAGLRRRGVTAARRKHRSEEHTTDLQSLISILYAVVC